MSEPQPSRPKAYSYVRFSTPDQGRGDSLPRQTDAARRYAAAHGLDLDERLTFRDLGVSAHHGRNAEVGALGAFLDARREGRVPAGAFLLVESLDRISRQTVRKAVRTLESIVETGITVVDLSDNGRSYNVETLDSDSLAFVMMTLRFIRAHEESATKGMRVAAAYDRKRAAAAAKSQAGVPFSRMLPAWLRWDDARSDYALIPERASVVREIFEKTAAGWGQHRIAYWLNARELKPWGRATYWHRSYVRKILTNAAAVGTFTPHKAIKGNGGIRERKPLNPIADFWPAAVDPLLFNQVRGRVAAGAPRGRYANRPTASIFAGVLRCAHCGGGVLRISKGSGEHVYLTCSKAHAKAGCKYQAVRYTDLETALINNIQAGRDTPLGEATAEFETELWGLNEGLLSLRDDAEALVTELARTRSELVRRRLQETEAKIEECEVRSRFLGEQIERHSEPFVAKRVARLIASLAEQPLDVAKANGALKEAFERMVLDPERGTLELRWRHRPGAAHMVQFQSKHYVADFPAVLPSGPAAGAPA